MFHMRMMRLRRYRVFLVFAVILTVVLARWHQGKLQSASQLYRSYREKSSGSSTKANVETNTFREEIWSPSNINVESLAPHSPSREELPENKIMPVTESRTSSPPTKTTLVMPSISMADRVPIPELPDYDDTNEIHMQPPTKVTPINNFLFDDPMPTIYWEKQKEHFPIDKITQLPTGKPVQIPKIQFNFPEESQQMRDTRIERLQTVRDEFKHAWSGYRDKAWFHDELMPVTGGVKDPFGGWSATLIDSLDSLYILGLEEEFEEAVEATSKINFKTVNRNDIPVFETTIRYMGGLLAAYDVSGGKHAILLEKARELGEILLGAFDSPNRMPELFYRWKPAFASQPHRASPRSNLAELGSLSLEFTRLAQITQDARYYDVVARITDALYEWQERGTALPGLFPADVDASGCNRTATDAKLKLPPLKNMPEMDSEGYETPMLGTARKSTKRLGGNMDDLEISTVPGLPGQPSRGKIAVVDENMSDHIKRDNSNGYEAGSATNAKGLNVPEPFSTMSDDLPAVPSPLSAAYADKARLAAGSRVVEDWDCVPQGLAPAMHSRQSYSMAGSQDSTYEYFTKQHLLLGGHAAKYESLYRKTLAGIKTNLLYRPMIPDTERKLLFSGAITIVEGILGDPPTVGFDAEVTHLTCFIGGMVGMGAKVFGIDTDIEVAKALTDGCVWAYESTKSGIMPESARTIPCESFSECPWNQTLWEQHIDPIWDKRDGMIADYDKNKARITKQRELAEIEEKQRLLDIEATLQTSVEIQRNYKDRNEQAVEGQNLQTGEQNKLEPGFYYNQEMQGHSAAAPKQVENSDFAAKLASDHNDVLHDSASKLPAVWEESQDITDAMHTDVDSKAPISTRETDQKSEFEHRFRRRDSLSMVDDASPKAEIPKSITHDMRAGQEKSSVVAPIGRIPGDPRYDFSDTPGARVPVDESQESKLYQKLRETENEINAGPHSYGFKQSASMKPTTPLEFDDNRPLSHKDWIAEQLRSGLFPEGFSQISSNTYKLRPEAIESVWYMYRITGDPIWQEKGWTMFRAIIKATKTEYGHSAVEGVTRAQPKWLDNMESFWLAETLKYFYLLFSAPDVISLDDWVLNTEAHPFKRPVA